MSTMHSNPLQEPNAQFNEAVVFGAEPDRTDVVNLFKWTIITVIVVIGLIFLAFELYTYQTFKTAESQAISTTYEILTGSKKAVNERLSSYGIVDETKKVYHLPIDKAMQLTVDAYSK